MVRMVSESKIPLEWYHKDMELLNVTRQETGGFNTSKI